jgi:putative zinc finger protein
MTSLACSAVRRQLQAYHDDELQVADQIAVASHIDGCAACGEALAELQTLGAALRAAAPGRTPLPCDEAAGFTSTVVNRARVEDEASLLSSIRELFDDRRVVYSAFGGATATLACLVIMLTMMRFAGNERTDSLAGMMNVLKAPAVGAEPIVIRPVVVDARGMWPRALSSFSDSSVDDTVLALSGVVSSEGKVSNIEINDGLGGVAMASMDTRRLENLVDAVSRTRFEPVMKEGAPVAVNMVLFVAHTTVRGGPARKRLADHVRRIGVVHRV